MNAGYGWNNDKTYYAKPTDLARELFDRVKLEIADGSNPKRKGAFYFRSAYRNDPEFSLTSLSRVGPVIEAIRFQRMIDSDATVLKNYQRLVSQTVEQIYGKNAPKLLVEEFREQTLGQIRASLKRLFPDLTLSGLGNPLDQGTFRFTKGVAEDFEYKNLSGGEKAAFDLVLDIVVNNIAFQDSVYCIDEPDAHMNTRIQGNLLEELYNLVPASSQLWIATHSIGMMRRARELYNSSQDQVVFLDFEDHDFDKKTVITPSKPTRLFWEKVLNVALDDLASLVAPKEVVVCEGNPSGALPGKNAEHDAIIYNSVFGEELPDVKFLAGGNAKDVASDRLGFVAALPSLVPGIKVRRLIDRDDHAPADVSKLASQGITTLGRRHLEAYTYDDEVLTALCMSVGKPAEVSALLAEKQAALTASIGRGNPRDDIKSAAGEIYTKAKQRLGLTGVGNDQMAFARNTLAPLLTPSLDVYAELKKDIFGA
jgi:hypothetical protein